MTKSCKYNTFNLEVKRDPGSALHGSKLISIFTSGVKIYSLYNIINKREIEKALKKKGTGLNYIGLCLMIPVYILISKSNCLSLDSE